MKKIMITALCCCFFSALQARPVSYPGGWTFMQMNDLGHSQVHIHYSPTARDSWGFKSEYWSNEKIHFYGAQYNRLIKRWNQPKEQANFYWKSGLGVAHKGANQIGYFTGLAIDWETRRYFTSYENRYYDFQNFGAYFSQKARLGVAPYIGDFGDLHTWLMVQVDHQPSQKHNFTVTPLLRLFKGPAMVEAGYSNRDEFLINFIYRL